jgi:hypothetical protein
MTPGKKPVDTYTGYILDEVFVAFGFSKTGLPRRLFWPPFWPIGRGFAHILANLDQDVAQLGLSAGAGRVLNRFIEQIEINGRENIPADGPLLVACNHPGAYDAFAAVACLGRDDLRLVVSDVPLLKTLPSVTPHLIFSSASSHGRMNTVRTAIRHLESGGAVFIFPTGLVDPDPAVLPGASEALGRWSESLELMLRRVPQTRLLATVVSGVLSPSAFRNPIVRLRKTPWDQRKLAEFIQVMTQFVFPHHYRMTPRISFAGPVTLSDLRQGRDPSASVMPAIIEHARRLLTAHTGAPQGSAGAGEYA